MIKKRPIMSRHCFGTIITKRPSLLTDSEGCIQTVDAILQEESVQELGKLVHEFPNKSFTIVIALAESHISIHTWPERHAIQIDVFLCNYLNNNTEKCQQLFDRIVAYFEPQEVNETVVERL